MAAMSTFSEILDNLIDALDEEKRALLAGAYEALPEIMEKKQRFSSLLDGQLENHNDASLAESGKARIEKIQSLSGANEKLLLAAKTGAQSAKARIEKIMNRENMVGTYTPNGSKLRAKETFITQQKLA